VIETEGIWEDIRKEQGVEAKLHLSQLINMGKVVVKTEKSGEKIYYLKYKDGIQKIATQMEGVVCFKPEGKTLMFEILQNPPLTIYYEWLNKDKTKMKCLDCFSEWDVMYKERVPIKCPKCGRRLREIGGKNNA